MNRISRRNANWFFAIFALVLSVATFTEPAFAQNVGSNLNVASSFLAQITTWLEGLGIAAATIALLWVGFKMMFAAATWKDVAPIFWGACLIGGASAIANVLI